MNLWVSDSECARPDLTEDRVEVARALASIVAVFYVLLWVLEGASRKWIPPTASPLYVARDVAVGLAFMVMLAYARPSKRVIPFIGIAFLIALLGIAQAILFQLPSAVLLVGERSYLAPLLLPAICAAFGGSETLHKMLLALCCTGPVQLVLVVVQSNSPIDAAINKQVGDTPVTFGIGDYPRVSGTFSAPAGLSTYQGILLATGLILLIYQGERARGFLTLVGVGALVSALGIATLGGSRTMILNSLFVVAGLLVVAVLGASRVAARVSIVVLLLIAVGWIGLSSADSTGINALTYRFSNAAGAEDVNGRLINEAVGFVGTPLTPIGDGVGSHTQVGIAAGSTLGWIEIESQKWVGELGIIGLVGFLALDLSTIGGIVLAVVRLAILKSNAWGSILIALSIFLPLILFQQLTQLPSAQAATGVAIAVPLCLYWYCRSVVEFRPKELRLPRISSNSAKISRVMD